MSAELERLSSYFSPIEINVIEASNDLPNISDAIDKLKLSRVSKVVIDSLVSEISGDAQVATHSLMSSPDEEDGREYEFNLSLGRLKNVPVNSFWELSVDVAADRHSSPDDSGFISDPNHVKLVEVGWELSGEKALTVELDYLVDEFLDYNQRLVFTRRKPGDVWHPHSDLPTADQTEVLLLIGSQLSK